MGGAIERHMLDKMRKPLLVLGLCSRAEIESHADQYLILRAIIGSYGIAQPVGQAAIDNAVINRQVGLIAVPRRSASDALRCSRLRFCQYWHWHCHCQQRQCKNSQFICFPHQLLMPDRKMHSSNACRNYLPLRRRWLTRSSTAPSPSSGIRPKRRATS